MPFDRPAAETVVAVATSDTVVLTENNSRDYALLQNDSDTDIYISLGNTAVVGQGIRIVANGGSYEMSHTLGNMFLGAINAIHGGAGTKDLMTNVLK